MTMIHVEKVHSHHESRTNAIGTWPREHWPESQAQAQADHIPREPAHPPVGNALPDEALQPRALLFAGGVRPLPPLPAPHQHGQVRRHEVLVRRRVEVRPAPESVLVIRAATCG